MILRQSNIYFELFDKYFDSFAVCFSVYNLISLTVQCTSGLPVVLHAVKMAFLQVYDIVTNYMCIYLSEL